MCAGLRRRGLGARLGEHVAGANYGTFDVYCLKRQNSDRLREFDRFAGC